MFAEGMDWAATVLESHLAYPILPYFRSSHDYESWVAAVGALLDASTLKMTVVQDGAPGHAKLFNTLGQHLVHDISRYFGLENDEEPGVERHEFDAARARLEKAGLTLREADAAWEQFVKLRGTYASQLNAMARHWRIPPAQWIGDRSSLRVRHIDRTAT